MKALRCLNCENIVIVFDNSAGFCGKCHMPLQEDKIFGKKLNLTKDIPQIVMSLPKKKSKKKIVKNKKINKKKQRKKKK